MIQLASLFGSTEPWALSSRNWVKPKPRKDRDPACRKSRRRMPSQNSTALSASSRNIGGQLQCTYQYRTAKVYPIGPGAARLAAIPEDSRLLALGSLCLALLG